MEKSIRKELMEKLGIGKNEVSNLIATYAKNHNGKVNTKEIEDDMDKITKSMIYELGNIYKDYDIRHEILECGKDRQEDGIMSLLDEEEGKLALQYLPNRYYENVNTWAYTLFEATKNKLSKILDGGIEEYRKFVDKLPYKNINIVASTYGLENEFAEFLAKNGNESDFQKFMTNIQPVRDNETELMEKYVSNYSGKLDRKSCPKNLSNKIFKKLQEELKENDTTSFERASIMEGLCSIHNNKNLTKTEGEQLQDLFMSHYLKGDVDDYFVRLARAKVAESFDTLKEYLEMDKRTSWTEKEEFLTQKVLPTSEQNIEKAYSTLLSTLKKKSKSNELTPEYIIEGLKESSLSGNGKNGINMLQDEETQKTKLSINIDNPIIHGKTMNIEIDGTKLKEIIDDVNSNSLNEANKKIKEIVQKGIGEISVINTYKTDERKGDSSDNIIGYLGEEKNSPYITGGELSYNLGLTDLQVKCPYDVISNNMNLQNEIAEMTQEQIEQFNHKAEPVKEKVHYYRFGRVDGYYNRDVYDFNINGVQYHIKDDDWTNGGNYTVIWKGKEEKENYPDTAIGLCSSKSEWARDQRGVNEKAVIKFINENPMRFSEYYDKYEQKSDCCGLYPTAHIERMCKDIMETPPESKLRELKEQEEQKTSEEFLDSIVNSATVKKDLTDKTKEAQELLSKYEQLDTNTEKTLSDK